MSNSVSIQSFLQLQPNMVTTSELREYMIAAYGKQISGQPFTASLVSGWVRIRRVPEIYGGYKVLEAKVVHPMRVTVLTLENFDRSILEDVKTVIQPAPGPKVQVPRKFRTKLYYEILKQKKPKGGVIPDKVTGIKGNQIPRRKKK